MSRYMVLQEPVHQQVHGTSASRWYYMSRYMVHVQVHGTPPGTRYHTEVQPDYHIFYFSAHIKVLFTPPHPLLLLFSTMGV